MKLKACKEITHTTLGLEFTPLEFETFLWRNHYTSSFELEFTPLEFETWNILDCTIIMATLEFTPLEFETSFDRIKPAKNSNH